MCWRKLTILFRWHSIWYITAIFLLTLFLRSLFFSLLLSLLSLWRMALNTAANSVLWLIGFHSNISLYIRFLLWPHILFSHPSPYKTEQPQLTSVVFYAPLTLPSSPSSSSSSHPTKASPCSIRWEAGTSLYPKQLPQWRGAVSWCHVRHNLILGSTGTSTITYIILWCMMVVALIQWNTSSEDAPQYRVKLQRVTAPWWLLMWRQQTTTLKFMFGSTQTLKEVRNSMKQQ